MAPPDTEFEDLVTCHWWTHHSLVLVFRSLELFFQQLNLLSSPCTKGQHTQDTFD